MIGKKIIASLVVSLAVTATEAQAKESYLKTGRDYGLSSQFGVTAPEFSQMDNGAFTPSRHHGWGQETGIGSSTSQTTAATVESMPAYNYQPTSVSPAFRPIRSGLNFHNLNFSTRMSSPALGPTTTTPESFSLSGQINPGAYESGRPESMSGQSYMLYGLFEAPEDTRTSPSRLQMQSPTLP